jgi:uncharacterized protein HemY
MKRLPIIMLLILYPVFWIVRRLFSLRDAWFEVCPANYEKPI